MLRSVFILKLTFFLEETLLSCTAFSPRAAVACMFLPNNVHLIWDSVGGNANPVQHIGE
jgi:hypothetical protein